jgi:hypothetical protein
MTLLAACEVGAKIDGHVSRTCFIGAPFRCAFLNAKRFLPEAIEIVADLGNARRLNAVEVARADRLVRNKTGIAQRAQMLRN